MTTSIPEAPDSGRNWDYRHCWLRDAYFVVDALNRLNTTDTMERYLALHHQRRGRQRRTPPCSRSTASTATRRSARRWWRACPGTGAWGRCGSATMPIAQVQHDVYGSAILAVDPCLLRRAPQPARRCCALRAARSLWGDARPWSSTSPTPDCGSCAVAAAVHTFSGVMCWAACDRLARIGDRLGLAARASLLATGGEQDFPIRIRTLLERPASKLCRVGRRRCAGRKHAASRRVRTSSLRAIHDSWQPSRRSAAT